MTNTSKDWSITRAELLGTYTLPRRVAIVIDIGMILVYLAAIVGLSFFLWSIFSEDSTQVRWWYLWPVASPGFLIPTDLLARAKRRRWKREAPRIWDADGCICPWCKSDVRTGACDAHGVGPEHRSLLIDFYSQPVLLEPKDKDAARLIDSVPRPPGFRYARSRLKTWSANQREIIRNRESTITQRLGSLLKLAGIYYSVTGAVLLGVFLFLPGLFPSPGGSGFMFLVFWLLFPLLFLMDTNLKFDRVCVSCQQQCPDLDQAFCNECGKDLQDPGATTRTFIGTPKTAPIMLIVVVFLTTALSPLLGDWLMGALPANLRRMVWGQLGVPTGYFVDIDVPNLTREEAMAEADLVLHLARPGGPGIQFSFDRDLIGLSLEHDLLPESYREKAARTTASATLELEESDDGWEILVTPRIDPSLLDKQRPRFAFGGVSIDGGPWSPGAPWTLVHEDLDPDHRREFSYLRSESELAFRVPIDLAPGRYEVEARCWLVLDGRTYSSLDLEFDPEGNPVLPQDTIAYDLPLMATIEIP